MDITATANALLPLLGGKENIASAAHCATRLRLVLVDDSKVDKEAIGKLDGVKGCFSNAGQIQVIFGTGLVNKVHAEFIKAAGVSESSKAEAADIAAKKLNPLQRIARLLSNIFVPIIPAIVASGLLMGLLGMVKTYGWADANSALFIMLDMFSSAAFIILPILIGFTAAREFGGNPYLGATLGGILTHPALTNAWGVAGGFHTMNFFGLDIAMIGYQGTVFPVLLTVWFMSLLEKRLRKVIPNALDLILTPFLTVVISGFVALLFIGPAGRALGDGISFVLSTLIAHAGWLAGLLFGGLYSAIVITGIHHSFHAVEAGLLGNPNIGVNFLLPIWSMANIAQGSLPGGLFQNPRRQNQSHCGAFGLFRHARHHRGGAVWHQPALRETVSGGAGGRRARRRMGGGQPCRHERGRADGDPRHGDRAGQFAGQLYHRSGDRVWQRLCPLPTAEIQNGRAMMEELSLIKQAMRAVMNGQPLALRDPHRPDWHLAPSVGLLNDPNGFIQHNGVYHLFYQWNPLGCDHRNKCWGHWQSADLLRWEHQPIALA